MGDQKCLGVASCGGGLCSVAFTQLSLPSRPRHDIFPAAEQEPLAAPLLDRALSIQTLPPMLPSHTRFAYALCLRRPKRYSPRGIVVTLVTWLLRRIPPPLYSPEYVVGEFFGVLLGRRSCRAAAARMTLLYHPFCGYVKPPFRADQDISDSFSRHFG